MSFYESNKHVGDLVHGSLDHAIEHRQVMCSHMAFNVHYLINKEGHVVCESN